MITVTGTQVSDAEIFYHASSIYTSGPFVIKLADDSYLMVYVKYDTGNYYIYKRTSSNFTSWSAASQLSIAGITTTYRTGNPSLKQITTGDIMLTFKHVEALGAEGEENSNSLFR